MPTTAQIVSVLQIETDASLITGATTITDVSNYSSIGVATPDTVKILLYIQDPTGDLFYKNAGYDAADFTSPDLQPLIGTDTYSYTLPTDTSGDYLQGTYNVNMKVQVVEGADTTLAAKLLYSNVCSCCNGIVPDVQGNVSYNTAVVSVIDYTNYKTFTSLSNTLVLYPPTNTGSSQTGVFHGSPATLIYQPPQGTFPYTGIWQWTLTADVAFTDSLTQSSTTCRITSQGSFSVVQSELCKVRCLLDKYRTDFYSTIAVKNDPQFESKWNLAMDDYMMAFASERCALPQTTINKYIENIYRITGIDPNCECGCGDGTSQPLVPTSIINGTNGTNGATIYSGSGAPAGGLGVVGDYYINTANGDYYNKTGASTWTFLFSAIGATGATGATGAAGATGADGASVLHSVFPNQATTTTGSYETLNTGGNAYSLPAAKLTTDGSSITINARYKANAVSAGILQNVAIAFGATPVYVNPYGTVSGFPILAPFYASNVYEIVLTTTITRTGNTTANSQARIEFYSTSYALLSTTNCPIQAIASLNFTTTAYAIAAQAYSVATGDTTLEALEVVYYKK